MQRHEQRWTRARWELAALLSFRSSSELSFTSSLFIKHRDCLNPTCHRKDAAGVEVGSRATTGTARQTGGTANDAGVRLLVTRGTTLVPALALEARRGTSRETAQRPVIATESAKSAVGRTRGHALLSASLATRIGHVGGRALGSALRACLARARILSGKRGASARRKSISGGVVGVGRGRNGNGRRRSVRYETLVP